MVGEPELVHPLAELDGAAAGAEHDADVAARLEIDGARIELRVPQRFVGRGDGHRHDARNVLHVLRVDPERRIEIDFAGDARRERRRVELRDGADAGTAGFQRGEVVLAADAVRAESADAGDDDSLVGHLGARQRDGQGKDCKICMRAKARLTSLAPRSARGNGRGEFVAAEAATTKCSAARDFVAAASAAAHRAHFRTPRRARG